MLIDVLNAYFGRIGVDVDFSAVTSSSDDYLDVTDPDLDFNIVRSKVLSNRVLSKRIVNQTVVSLELFDTMWDDEGNKLNLSILLCVGGLGFGTRAKVLVRTIDAVVNGSVKSFLSVEAYKNYIDSKAVEV